MAASGNIVKYTFSGAGNGDFNGTFVCEGDKHNDKNYYKYGANLLWYDTVAPGWVLGYTLDSTAEYTNTDTGTLPPTSGWAEANSSTPPSATTSAESVTAPYSRPNLDVTANGGWDTNISYWAWGNVRGTSVSPNAPNSPGHLDSGGGSKILTFGMSSFDVLSVSKVKVWVYGYAYGVSTLSAEIYDGSDWSSAQNLGLGANGWYSYEFSVSWNQAAFDALQVRLTESNPEGDPLGLSQVYAEITYESGVVTFNGAQVIVIS